MFYEFRQNNSYGYFEENEKLCHILVIEADSEQSAIEKAEDFGCYWNGVEKGIDCPCCGDRWYSYPDEINIDIDGFNTIEECIQDKVNRSLHWTTPEARIFYANDTVKDFSKTKEIRY